MTLLMFFFFFFFSDMASVWGSETLTAKKQRVDLILFENSFKTDCLLKTYELVHEETNNLGF